MSRGLIFCSASQPSPSRSSAPGPKFSNSTSDFAMTSRNRRFPSSLFRLSVRLRLLALNSRKKRLSESGLSRILRRATSPPFGSSSLMTSAPKNARIWAQAGPAWLCVISTMRIPERALSMAWSPVCAALFHVLIDRIHYPVVRRRECAEMRVLSHDDAGFVVGRLPAKNEAASGSVRERPFDNEQGSSCYARVLDHQDCRDDARRNRRRYRDDDARLGLSRRHRPLSRPAGRPGHCANLL